MTFLELFGLSLMSEKQFLMCSDVPDAQCPDEALHVEIFSRPKVGFQRVSPQLDFALVTSSK